MPRKKQMQQNFRSVPLMACMMLGDAFKPKYEVRDQKFSLGALPPDSCLSRVTSTRDIKVHTNRSHKRSSLRV